MIIPVLVNKGYKRFHILNLIVHSPALLRQMDDALLPFPDQELNMVAGNLFFDLFFLQPGKTSGAGTGSREDPHICDTRDPEGSNALFRLAAALPY